MEYRWALQSWGGGRDTRELLDTEGQLEAHLEACQTFPSQLWLFRFHPDVWEKNDLEESDPGRLYASDLWADCLSLYRADEKSAVLNYFREAGDDGLLLYHPEAELTPDQCFRMVHRFLETGFLPEAPQGFWWMDGDEQKLTIDEIWDEQQTSWDTERQKWTAWLRPYNGRGRTYAEEFARGQRECPLCHQKGGILYQEGGELQRCRFSCQQCGRPFDVDDVDRTPLERVE